METNEKDRFIIFLFIDLLILNLSVALTSWASVHFLGIQVFDKETYWLQANVAWITCYFLFFRNNFYLHNGLKDRILRATKYTVIFLAISLIIAFIHAPANYSSIFLLGYISLFFLGRLIFYGLLYVYLKHTNRSGISAKRVLIVGLNETTRFFRQLIDNNPLLGYQVVGYASQEVMDEDLPNSESALSEIIRKNNIQFVFASLSFLSERNNGNAYLRVCNQLGVRLRFIPENQPWLKATIVPKSVKDIVVINPQRIPLDDVGARVTKRLFDILFSLGLILLVFSWLFPILALLIRLESKGPVFFVQKRTGINNRDFNCLKFRSMTVNKDSDNVQATQNDNRLTRMGRWMRKTNVDELPQFINVLMGQMSIVGPRPHMLKHTVEYSAHVKHYLVRHYVKPGITGWAQVNGWRGPTDTRLKTKARVLHDLWYVEHWNFGLDLWIIWLTVFGKKSRLNAF